MAQQLIVNTLVVGMTGCGKSTLVRDLIVDEQRKTGREILIYDPTGEEWPDAALKTSDEQEYLRYYWGSENCICVMDESLETIGLWNKGLISCSTRGRHKGHHNYFLTQAVRGLAPTLIGNCTELYCFRCGPKNAGDLAEDFDCKELLGCPDLKQYQYFHLLVWGPDGKHRIRKV